MTELTSIRADIAILDFGSQFTHMVSRRLRGKGVYCEIFSPEVATEELIRRGVRGIILSGGPSSVYLEDAPPFNAAILEMNLPVLGICYGFQLLAHVLGGGVIANDTREYGSATLTPSHEAALFAGTPPQQTVWMSHGDLVVGLPNGFEVVASTPDCTNAAAQDLDRAFFGLQFHPEVAHTEWGSSILANFAIGFCGCTDDWDRQAYLSLAEKYVVDSVRNRNVFLLVSGGIDSVVVFSLLNRVLGPERVRGLFIDTGLLRPDEADRVRAFLTDLGAGNFVAVDASKDFLRAIDGVHEPEAKRTAIGELFLDVKDRVMADMSLDPSQWVLAQGTIYPDIITSGGAKNSHVIKTHHNALPSMRNLEVIEPIRNLYKDEVRELAAELALPNDFISRHPFPGPGVAVRIAGEVTEAKLETYHAIDAVVMRHIRQSGWYERLWMGFPVLIDVAEETVESAPFTGEAEAILGPILRERMSLPELAVTESHASVLPIRSVGVKGDYRTYEHPVQSNLRSGGARAHVPHDVIEKTSRAITNRVPLVNRVLLTLSSDHAPNTWRRIVVFRALQSVDTLTSDWAKLEHDLLDAMARDVRDTVADIDAVLYDVTQKPPGIMEWE